jgi:hypothetical protein
MWITLVIIILSLLLFLYVFRQNVIETTYPQIHTLTLLVCYIPIFIVKGLGPAILAMRKCYGPTFCLHIWGMKRRIFFITDSNGRSVISRNTHIRLPAAQVAQVFGISKETTGKNFNHLTGHVKSLIIHQSLIKLVIKLRMKSTARLSFFSFC